MALPPLPTSFVGSPSISINMSMVVPSDKLQLKLSTAAKPLRGREENQRHSYSDGGVAPCSPMDGYIERSGLPWAISALLHRRNLERAGLFEKQVVWRGTRLVDEAKGVTFRRSVKASVGWISARCSRSIWLVEG